MINLPDLRTAQVNDKKVFLRTDIDVPLSQQTTNNKQQTTIADDTRLRDSLETLKYLLDNGAQVILAGHLGRPDGLKRDLSVEPVAKWYQNKLKIKNEKLKMI